MKRSELKSRDGGLEPRNEARSGQNQVGDRGPRVVTALERVEQSVSLAVPTDRRKRERENAELYANTGCGNRSDDTRMEWNNGEEW